MEPYDNNPNEEKSWYPESDSPESDDPQADSGEYRIVRPDAERSWKDADYTPQSETTEPPRFYQPPAEKPKKEKAPKAKGQMTFAKVACLCLCCALIGGVAGGAVTGSVLSGGPEPTVTEAPVLEAASPTPASAIAASSGSSIYDMGCEQVVGVTTAITTQTYFGTSSGTVSGSGFILTEDGYIMTNYHVIEDAHKGGYEIKVMLHSGDQYTASIVGFDSDYDIAVLKIDAAGLSPVTLGDSDALSVGDTVYAIGNPLGQLAYTMTSGIISGTNRVITTSAGSNVMFQFDAAVNEGNSGGPVYNAAGQVVGVVTAKYSESGVEGLGFAIPINDAVKLANDLMSQGYVSGKAYLGINGQDVSASAIQYYNMPAGVYVTNVGSGSAAEAAGIKVGDIITELDGTAAGSMTELKAAVKTHSAGDSAAVRVYRSGEYLDLTITFDEQPQAAATDDSQTQQGSQQQDQYQQYQQYQQYIQQMLPSGW